MPASAASQLVVDAPRLVALGTYDVQASGLDHLIVQHLPIAAHLLDLQIALRKRERFVFAHLEDQRLHCPTEHDIGTASRHVGRDSDHLGAAGLSDDLRLAGVLLGVEHLMRQLLLLQILGQELRVLDRGRADEHRLPALVAILDVGNDGVDFLLECAEDEIVLIGADHR